MRTFLLALLAIIFSPFVLIAFGIMVAAFIKMIIAGFMFAIPAFFVYLFLILLLSLLDTENENKQNYGGCN